MRGKRGPLGAGARTKVALLLIDCRISPGCLRGDRGAAVADGGKLDTRAAERPSKPAVKLATIMGHSTLTRCLFNSTAAPAISQGGGGGGGGRRAVGLKRTKKAAAAEKVAGARLTTGCWRLGERSKVATTQQAALATLTAGEPGVAVDIMEVNTGPLAPLFSLLLAVQPAPEKEAAAAALF
ncbi:unnamed protein product [Arctogadus glacialis]